MKGKNLAILFARILLAAPFLVSAIGSITNFAGIKIMYLTIKKFPYPGPSLALAISMMLLGSLSLLLGYRMKIGAALLAIFVVTVSISHHSNFSNPMQIIQFTRNIAILGGLVFAFITPPGKYSIGKKD